jgi:hypothetical protein
MQARDRSREIACVCAERVSKNVREVRSVSYLGSHHPNREHRVMTQELL